jgi:hypothetical protein
VAIDVLERDDLPFPHSLPEFQRLFPDEGACAAYLERARWSEGFACSDDWSGYARLGERGYSHTAVAERGDMQVAETFLPIIHLVFSNLKTWLRGIHHGVSPQHLQAYLNEFTFRFNRRFYPFNAFRSLLGIAGDVTAPTYADLYAAKSRTTTSSGCVDNPISTQ